MAEDYSELNNLVVNFPPKPGVLTKLKSEGWFNDSSAQTINEVLPDQIPSIGSGAFHFVGSVADISDLPNDGNDPGDLYYVRSDSAEYVWMIDATTQLGYWEKLGDSGERFVLQFSKNLNTGSWVMGSNSGELRKAKRLGKTIWFQINDIAVKAHVVSFPVPGHEYFNYYAHILMPEDDTLIRHFDIKVTTDGDEVEIFRVTESIVVGEKIEDVDGATPTIIPEDHYVYNCGELTSLTISNPPASGAYSIVFTSGATPTVTTFPATILGLEDFAAEANTAYEINVLDNKAVVGSWAVTA